MTDAKSRFTSASLLVALTFLVACQKTATLSSAERPAKASPAESRKEEATWSFHPRLIARERDRIAVGPEEFLSVDEAGTRWLKNISGEGHSSAYGAPEPLTGVGREGALFLFLGRSGVVYAAEAPLGPFVEWRVPDERFSRAALYRKGTEIELVAVADDGSLHRSKDAGRRWSRVFEGEHFVEAEFDRQGRILALSVPERFWRSEDAATFLPLDWPSVGAHRLSRDDGAEGALRVAGLRGDHRVSAEVTELVPLKASPAKAEVAPPSASSLAVSRGHADFSGDSYAGLVRDGDRWLFETGSFSGSLGSREIPTLKHCEDVRLKMGGKSVHVLCHPRGGGGIAPKLEWWKGSVDGNFSRVKVTLRGALDEVTMVTSDEGALALVGICPPQKSEMGCAPVGLFATREETLLPVPFPSFGELRSLAFDGQGRLWTLGHRAADGTVEVRVARFLGARMEEVGSLSFDELSTGLRERGPRALRLLPGKREMSVFLEGKTRRTLVTLGLDLSLTGIAEVPRELTLFDGFGTDFLGVDPALEIVWESRDGGASFVKTPLPRALCGPGARDCHPTLSCRSSGCLVGEELTRVGYGSSRELGNGAFSFTAVPRKKSETTLGFRCRSLSEGYEDLPGISATPTASGAALGEAAWAEVASDPNTGEVWSLGAVRGQRELFREPLFGPLAKPEEYALAVVPQVEGGAAVRFRVPGRSSGRNEHTEIEVAWDNRVAGIRGQGKLGLPIRPRPGDTESRAERTERARPALLSIAGDGLYFRMHGSPESTEQTYFFVGDTLTRVPRFVWPLDLQPTEQEMFRVQGTDVAVGWFQGGRALLRAERVAEQDLFTPYLLGVPDAEARGLLQTEGVAYLGKEVALFSAQIDRMGHFWSAKMVPLLAGGKFGAPLTVPLIGDLSEPATPCAARPTAAPRVVSPPFQGLGRQVLIEQSAGLPLRLTTESAVLSGTRQAPCVTLFDATSGTPAVGEMISYRALVFPGEGEVSWLFREERRALGPSLLSARPLDCD